MRILVVDDHYVIEAGVARALEQHNGHVVVGASSPAALRNELTRGTDFGLAFVDLHYGAGAPESGLAALEALAGYDIPCILYTSDGEQNRPLYLLAAFEFFPDTSTVLSKTAGDVEIARIVDIYANGLRPGPGASQRYRSPGDRTSLLKRLVGTSDDLILWRSLAKFTKLREIAADAHCSEKKVSDFISLRQSAIAEFEHEVMDLPVAPSPPTGERQRPLLDAHRFATVNADFFADPDVERLVRGKYDGEKRRSDAARTGDRHRRRGFRK